MDTELWKLSASELTAVRRGVDTVEVVDGHLQRIASKKRTVYVPQPEDSPTLPAVISVELDEDEDVEWVWTHTSDGKSVITGYIITEKTDKPRKEWETLHNGEEVPHRGRGGGAHEALEESRACRRIIEPSGLE